MTDYLSSVLDELVPTFEDEDGDWERVVAHAGETDLVCRCLARFGPADPIARVADFPDQAG